MKHTKSTFSFLLLVVSYLGLASSTFAAGAYLGLGAGASQLQGYNITTPSKQHIEPGGRIFAGYNVNEFFGIEAGVARYATTNINTGQFAPAQASLLTADLVAKAYLPISNSGLSLYGLGGAALVHSDLKYGSGFHNGSLTNPTIDHVQNAIRPIYGLGASYDIPQTQFTTGVEFTHIQGRGDVYKDRNAIPSANLATINLIYNFN